jgi:hypothetical protein
MTPSVIVSLTAAVTLFNDSGVFVATVPHGACPPSDPNPLVCTIAEVAPVTVLLPMQFWRLRPVF